MLFIVDPTERVSKSKTVAVTAGVTPEKLEEGAVGTDDVGCPTYNPKYATRLLVDPEKVKPVESVPIVNSELNSGTEFQLETNEVAH
jgi:hypothetical protein